MYLPHTVTHFVYVMMRPKYALTSHPFYRRKGRPGFIHVLNQHRRHMLHGIKTQTFIAAASLIRPRRKSGTRHVFGFVVFRSNVMATNGPIDERQSDKER
jgi:hypothetical protein